MTWAPVLDLASEAARDVFGTSVSYTPQSTGTPETLTAIFDPAHVEADVGGEVGVSAVGPVLDLVLADLSVDPAQGDAVTIAGTDYVVADIQPDGHGTAKLWLLRA